MKTKSTTQRRFALPAGFLLGCVAGAASAVVIDPFSAGSSTAVAGQQTISYEALLTKVHERGTARVIVRLATPFQPEGIMPQRDDAVRQGGRIASVRRQLLGSLLGYSPDSVKSFGHAPMLAFEVDALGLEMLRSSPLVAQFVEDKAMPALLPQSVPLVGADEAWGSGFSGAGETVAILDTGVDRNHPFLAGKVVAEACFSTTYRPFGATTVCPNGQSAQTGGGAAVPCKASGCDHGTHVAGIAAGRGTQFSGVARDSRIIAVQVFSQINDPQICGSFGYPAPCPAAFSSDVIKGLEYVYQLRNQIRIASANLSLGTGRFTGHCDSEMPKPAIDNLRSVGIATVIAAGNSGYRDALSFPACISSAVSVGASNKNDGIASFSNNATILKLLAPGDGYSPFDGILSSLPGGGFHYKAGTSMAAPHVAGAWAVLKSVRPAATVDQVLGALANGGRPLFDPRNGLTKPRIRVDKALALLAGWINDDLAIDFGVPLGSYAWVSNKGFVSRIHALPTQQLVAADFDGNGRSDLALAFAEPYSGIWLWVNGAGWVRIHSLSATHMAAGDFNRDGRSDLAIDFGAPFQGLWLWINGYGFIKINDLSVSDLATGDFDGDGRFDLAVDFGAPYDGLWIWRSGVGWSRIATLSTRHLTVGDFSGDGRADLGIDFGPSSGIWIWTLGVGLTPVHPSSAVQLAAAHLNADKRADLAIDFGEGVGIWAWVNGTGLTAQIHPGSAAHLTVVDYNKDGYSDLAIDFGANLGIFAWVNGYGFTARIHPHSARSIVAGHLD